MHDHSEGGEVHACADGVGGVGLGDLTAVYHPGTDFPVHTGEQTLRTQGLWRHTHTHTHTHVNTHSHSHSQIHRSTHTHTQTHTHTHIHSCKHTLTLTNTHT